MPTLKEFWKRMEYPEYPLPLYPEYPGRHFLNYHPVNGMDSQIPDQLPVTPKNYRSYAVFPSVALLPKKEARFP